MSGLIAGAKERIWSIATLMATAELTPVISMRLVAYRDRGDAYVTQSTRLDTDLDAFYSQLMQLTADGGDMPESVNQGLCVAIHDTPWSIVITFIAWFSWLGIVRRTWIMMKCSIQTSAPWQCRMES